MIQKLQKKYEKELNIIKDNMRNALLDFPSNETMKELLNEIVDNPGKMLRPLLMLLIAGDTDNKDELYATAAGMELIHNSSLVLDDMLDKAPTRRGKPTVVNRYGDPVALCVGDFIIAEASQYILNKNYIESANEMIKAIECACNGEMIQNLNRGNTDIDEETYFNAINGKTAALFQLVCESAARISGKDIKEMGNLGNIIGTMFQLRDDLLDWTSTEEEIGKPVNEDFTEGIYTLPAIYTFKDNKYDSELKELANKKDLNNEDLIQIRNIVNISGGIEYTKNYIKDLANKARSIINSIKDNETKQIFNAIIDNLEA